MENPQPRTGILTFHRCVNYGSYWQVRCLVEGLRSRGHDAVIVDHDSWRINLAEWKCALRPVLPTPVPSKDYLLYGLKLIKFARAVSSLPRSPRFALERAADMESFDRVVVGSDEVWNLIHPWYGGCSLFFGASVRARRLVSYAASFGNYDASNGLEPVWADQLRRFEAISVRDENSRSIIKNALGFEPELVLDPCLQFMPEPEGPWRGPHRPFVAVYGHNFSETFGREVRRWARSRGYPLISLGYRNDWADSQWITAGPRRFAHGIAQAKAVATNFFHGCVFALRYAKPFVCESSPYRYTKVQNLMETVGGEKHLVVKDTPALVYDARLSEPLDPDMLDRIDRLRRASGDYLDHALG
ncbi:polysaccharide pyruvyl transferase family protein [Methylocaldum sp.]|uniref:polysaccharide pyruvyl transferase family protein n=1 Tax=Methylocaldum sp. TaxID=1969727 RepID=UPI002D277B08|nr:polysaccharide pyruvyl transferase family protein [Methylocaldum sp.]HYE38024.1 polysaccharide pyruvyl transferase family protein [Methylocaldum sp.]